MGEGVGPAGEGTVGGKRQLRRDDSGIGEGAAIFLKQERTGDPQLRRLVEPWAHPLEIEEAHPPEGELDIAHCLERHSDQDPEGLSLGLYQGKDGHPSGDLVAQGSGCTAQQQQGQQGGAAYRPGCPRDHIESILFRAPIGHGAILGDKE